MTKMAQSMFLIVTTSETILGICCNGFIWLVNCISLAKSKKMSLSEFVITSLAISRICLLCILIADVFLLFYTDFNETSTVMQIISILWTFANFLSISLATCLSIFYCLKIANFSHRAFLWLKWRVSHVVRWILMASVLFSFFGTFILIKEFDVTHSYRQMTPTANCTEDIREKKSVNFVTYIFTALWMIMPFIASLISYVLSILSLRRHTQQMQNNGTGSRDPSTEAHVRATKIILSFLFLFIVYLVAFFIILLGVFMPDANLAWITGEMILAAHPSIHSILLIVSNNKLKQAFLRMFQIKK
ncbi:taste receptor type 2 member 3-like [Trichosurus vulpecula]|uniref:taste receptor type 2 member 3-like n=1 Tax=Trichosurus vulpecula TaxID=9337 RepID=UPI00186B072B|nr:taste receptor type 2 member 3-like [Trichosurus vulpecula]